MDGLRLGEHVMQVCVSAQRCAVLSSVRARREYMGDKRRADADEVTAQVCVPQRSPTRSELLLSADVSTTAGKFPLGGWVRRILCTRQRRRMGWILHLVPEAALVYGARV
mmetsp:Transcript_20910/g.35890  ORF Transcript_20910/g.35890 Transcript_20910/m.35890 type:complete len:110 (-) Transcript_20910:806-1135(-)